MKSYINKQTNVEYLPVGCLMNEKEKPIGFVFENNGEKIIVIKNKETGFIKKDKATLNNIEYSIKPSKNSHEELYEGEIKKYELL